MPQIYNAYRGCHTPATHRAIVAKPVDQPKSRVCITDGMGLKLYLWLFDIAKEGGKCPSNDSICERFGFGSWATASRLVATLESTGLIEVERQRTSRRVFVRELERWTA